MQGHLLPFEGMMPKVADDVFLAPGVMVIGDVEIGAGSSVWYNAVIRGDIHSIRIGRRSNIQDGTVIHVTGGRFDTVIGDEVLVGHKAMIHGCRLEDRAFIGMCATILDACVVEGDAMVAAGAVLTPGKVVKAGQLWAGNPAKYMRDLRPEEIAQFKRQVASYAERAQMHKRSLAGL